MRPVMFSSALMLALEPELLLGEQRRQVLEHDLVLALLGRQAVDLVDLDQREVALAVLGHPHFAFDHVAGVQVEAADLAGREVDVVGAGHVAGFGRAQEAEAVGQDLEHAVAEDLLAALGALLHDREHQLLLAHAGDVLDLQLFAHLDEFGDVERLEFGQMHGFNQGGESRARCHGRERFSAGSRQRHRLHEAKRTSKRRGWSRDHALNGVRVAAILWRLRQPGPTRPDRNGAIIDDRRGTRSTAPWTARRPWWRRAGRP